jgi:hypothetical protein
MENNENFVAEQAAENVEITTEETPKTYTEAEFNAKLDEVLGKKIARREAKIRKEYERKYGDLEEVLKAGTGKESVGEITDTFRDFYAKKGIQFQQKPTYSDKDNEVLAKAEADEIIRLGLEDVVEEVDRLAEIGVENMTSREKALFKVLAEHRQEAERSKELSQIGVTEDVYKSKEFTEFASMFNSKTPIKDIYDIYTKQQPKKEIKTMGSMKNTAVESAVKEYYSPDEAKKFSRAELDKNPALFNAIMSSMAKWK